MSARPPGVANGPPSQGVEEQPGRSEDASAAAAVEASQQPGSAPLQGQLQQQAAESAAAAVPANPGFVAVTRSLSGGAPATAASPSGVLRSPFAAPEPTANAAAATGAEVHGSPSASLVQGAGLQMGASTLPYATHPAAAVASQPAPGSQAAAAAVPQAVTHPTHAGEMPGHAAGADVAGVGASAPQQGQHTASEVAAATADGTVLASSGTQPASAASAAATATAPAGEAAALATAGSWPASPGRVAVAKSPFEGVKLPGFQGAPFLPGGAHHAGAGASASSRGASASSSGAHSLTKSPASPASPPAATAAAGQVLESQGATGAAPPQGPSSPAATTSIGSEVPLLPTIASVEAAAALPAPPSAAAGGGSPRPPLRSALNSGEGRQGSLESTQDRAVSWHDTLVTVREYAASERSEPDSHRGKRSCCTIQ
ncbi:hypothetical protein N2152v2_011245 [Parachlorella kessleri]